jgi:hypothetical protein
MPAYFRKIDALPLLLLSLLGVLAVSGPAYAQDEVVDTQINQDPHIPVGRTIRVFHERLLPLWLQALERPEADLKRQAAATIALAHQKGMAGLEACVGPLLHTFAQPDLHPTVRLAVAQALIELDARQAADVLFAHAKEDGIDMRSLVEPALARWDYLPIRTIWLERLGQPGLAARSWIIAIQALAAVRETKAIPRLRDLMMAADTDPIVRIEAAKALGQLQTSGLEHDAETLNVGKASPGNMAHLEAAYLLRRHRGVDAANILARLAVEAEPAAALAALDGLLENEALRVVPLVPKLSASPDAGVRAAGIEAFRLNPAVKLVSVVGALMNDAHPLVRTNARRALADVARQPEYRDAIRALANRLIDGSNWRELEQTIILVVNLDDKATASKLVKLLEFDRPEVFVTAAWGLRKLGVADTLPAQLREIERRWQIWGKRGPNLLRDAIDAQLAQLCESMGQARYAAAAPTLAKFVPKIVLKIFGARSRIAAIWSLGIIHEKRPPADLVAKLVERLEDDQTLDPEDLGVRRECAISLGRMKAKDAVASLKINEPMRLSTSAFVCACAWAMEQITGEQQEVAAIEKSYYLGWFLEPNR